MHNWMGLGRSADVELLCILKRFKTMSTALLPCRRSGSCHTSPIRALGCPHICGADSCCPGSVLDENINSSTILDPPGEGWSVGRQDVCLNWTPLKCIMCVDHNLQCYSPATFARKSVGCFLQLQRRNVVPSYSDAVVGVTYRVEEC